MDETTDGLLCFDVVPIGFENGPLADWVATTGFEVTLGLLSLSSTSDLEDVLVDTDGFDNLITVGPDLKDLVEGRLVNFDCL